MERYMRISALTVQNFKGLRKVAIDCDKEVIVLAGKNGAGKSSALDAITALLMGKSAIPAEPIRRGENEGEIVAVIDGFTVRRTFTRKENGDIGGSLTITSADGMRAPSPQTWLDARINALGCDPIAFMASKPAEQAATLRTIAGVDTTALDVKRKAAFDSRTDIGRTGKDEAGALASMAHHPDAPAEVVEPVVVTPELVSASDIVAELAVADATARAKEAATRDAANESRVADTLLDIHSSASGKVGMLRRQLADAEEEERVAAGKATAKREEATRLASEANALVVTDPTPIRERLADVERANAEALRLAAEQNAAARKEADALNAKVRANAARKAQEEKVAAGRKEYAAKTAEIAALDAERAAMLAAATFPVKGLGFDLDGSVTFDGLPLAQVNEAKRIEVSMAIALAGDKPVKLVLIRNGSQLDEENMQLVADIAHAAGAQLWLERVGVADAGAVVIRDGGVA
jgi:energy-coupling factor transporter ATP-binding protein EcfA2